MDYEIIQPIQENISRLQAYSLQVANILFMQYIRDEENLHGKYPDRPALWPDIMQYASKNACGLACYLMGSIVYTNSKEDFPLIAVLRGNSYQSRRLHNPDWIFHCYTLLGDKHSNYYAISPANYDSNRPDSMFSAIYSTDINELLRTIKENDGGEWPCSEIVTEKLDQYNGCKNFLFRPGRVVEITKIVEGLIDHILPTPDSLYVDEIRAFIADSLRKS